MNGPVRHPDRCDRHERERHPEVQATRRFRRCRQPAADAETDEERCCREHEQAHDLLHEFARGSRPRHAARKLREGRERSKIEIQSVAAGQQNKAECARTRVTGLEASLREAQGESSRANKEAVKLREQERDAAANRSLC